MEINCNNNYMWELDAEAMRALITGKIVWKRCYSCDKGVIWWNEDGIVVGALEAETLTYCDHGPCDDCYGVGFIYVGDGG